MSGVGRVLGGLALAAALASPGCGGEVSLAELCGAQESADDCQAAHDGCIAVHATDVTGSTEGGEPCYHPVGGRSPSFFRCVPNPGGGDAAIHYRADPDTGRCLVFGSGSLTPPGWPECAEVMASCGE
jgi:hypothetical protein